MKVLGLIPARIGSTGVKRKNIRNMAGEPLIAYTAKAARASRCDRVVLTTDSPEIAEIGRALGLDVPFLRPAEFATTEATAIGVIGHALDWLAREEGYRPDAVHYLQPTSPFRETTHIDAAIDLLAARPDAPSVISVAPPASHPYYMYREEAKGGLKPLFKLDKVPERRQDLPPMWSLNNAIHLSRTAYLQRAAGGIIVDLVNFVPMPIEAPVTVDINTETDFQFADFLMGRRKGQE